MKLIECFVENFGKLHQYKMEFSEGLNVLIEDNGFGKTTFAAFIEALFYGLDTGRTKDSDRKKYEPWQGGRYGGSLIFSLDGKTYRLERFFGKKEKDDTFTLYNNETGLESSDFTANIGEEIFKIDKESYEKCAYIPQGKILTDLATSGDINAKLSDLLEAENDLGSFEDAMSSLKDSKNKLKRTGGIIYSLENRKSAIEDRLKKTEALTKAENELKEYISEKRAKKRSIQEEIEKKHSIAQKKEIFKFYESLKNDVTKSEEKIEALRNSVKKIPSDEGLSRLKNVTEKYKSALAIHGNIEFIEKEELMKLDALKSEVGKRRLSKETYEEIQKDFVKYKTAKEMLCSAELTDAEKERFDRLKAKFKDTPPNDDEINDIYYNARSLNDTKPGKKSSKNILIPVGIVLLTAGILAGILYNLYLGLSFACLGVLSLAIFLLILMNDKKIHKENSEQKKNVIQNTKDFFLRYDIVYDGDIQKAIRELKVLTEEYNKLALKKDKANEYSENSELSLYEGRIIEKSFSYFGEFSSIKRAEEMFEDLYKKTEWIKILTEKKKASEEGKAAIKESLESLKAVAEKYTDTDMESAYEFVLKVRTELLSEEEYYKEKAKELKSFITKNGIPEDLLDDDRKHNLSLLKESLDALDEEIISLEKRLMEIASETEVVPELLSEYEGLLDEIAIKKKKLSIIEKTEEALTKAKENLAVKYLGPLSENFEIYKKLLLAPSDAKLDAELNIGIVEFGEKHSSASYSYGTKDILAIALRFALIESLFEEEKPMVILDDPFVNLDERRIKEARKTLDVLSQKYQILYFACHDSRK